MLGALALVGSAAAPGTAATVRPAEGLGGPVVIGIPLGGEGRGNVQIERHDGGPTDVVGTTALGIGAGAAAMHLGTSVVVGDVTGDGVADYVVGAPTGGAGRAGRAFLIRGGGDFVVSSAVVELKAGQVAGDYFGWSVAISRRTDGSGTDIVVGAPSRTVSGHPDAGAVFRFPVTADGAVGSPVEITEDSPGIPGVAEPEDEFGSVLASATGGVLVGTPYEDVGRAVDAGSLTDLRLGPGAAASARLFTQATPGVPGTPERRDQFGSSVAPGGVLVGAPGEAVGPLRDAGAVSTFSRDADGNLLPGPAFTQDSAGIPGVAEAGDRFGHSVAVGRFRCAGVASMAVGAPWETLAGRKYAGTVVVAPMPGAGSCPPVTLTQGSGLPGVAEAYDQNGWSLASVPGGTVLPADTDQLVIGAPGEQVGRQVGAGAVTLWRPTGRSVVFGYRNGSVANLNFGQIGGHQG